MSPAIFTMALISGAAMLALWTDGRFPGLQPASVKARLVNAGVAAVTISIVPVPTTPGGLQIAVLLCLFMPALVYAFLTGVWLLRSLQSGLLGS